MKIVKKSHDSLRYVELIRNGEIIAYRFFRIDTKNAERLVKPGESANTSIALVEIPTTYDFAVEVGDSHLRPAHSTPSKL